MSKKKTTENGDSIGDWRKGAFDIALLRTVVVAIVISVVIACLLFLNVDDFNGKEEDVVAAREVVAMNVDSEISGKLESRTFILVSSSNGELSEDNYYKLFVKTDDGGIKMEKIPTGQATIYESNNDSPHYEKISTFKQLNDLKWGKVVGTRLDDKPERVTYKIYVPEGTVKTEFSVN